MRPEVVTGRVLLAGLLGWMAWIHLHLWEVGYRHIHVVGPLFLANSVAAIAVSVAVLAAPSRVLPVPSLSGALLAGGTLVGLAVSIDQGLFGFHDSLHAPFARLSIVVEVAATVIGLLLTFRSAQLARGRRAVAGTRSLPAEGARSRG